MGVMNGAYCAENSAGTAPIPIGEVRDVNGFICADLLV
jgi:hypothetical protein